MSKTRGKAIKTPVWTLKPADLFDSNGILPSWMTEYSCFQWRIRGTEIVNSLRTTNTLIGPLTRLGYVIEFRQTHEVADTKRKEPDEQTYEEVTVVSVDSAGVIFGTLIEKRAVYHNSKGKYIKVRGRGRIFLDETMTARVRGYRR